MALTRLWAKLIREDESSGLVNELRMHGVPIYLDVFVNLCKNFLSSENIILLAKNQAATYAELFNVANQEIFDLLKRHVPTFAPS